MLLSLASTLKFVEIYNANGRDVSLHRSTLGRVNPSLTNALCTGCGLCCDGSLFADIELRSSTEASALESMGLNIEDAEEDEPPLLLQPCGALAGTRCGIYAHRPKCCRTFRCLLLQEVEQKLRSLEDAKRVVAEARRRVDHLTAQVASAATSERLPLKELYFNALDFCQTEHLPDRKDHRRELNTAMAEVETIISKHFLGRGT